MKQETCGKPGKGLPKQEKSREAEGRKEVPLKETWQKAHLNCMEKSSTTLRYKAHGSSCLLNSHEFKKGKVPMIILVKKENNYRK